MGFRQAEHLSFFCIRNEAEWILARAHIVAIVDGVGAIQSIFVRNIPINARDSEVFPNRIWSGVVRNGCTLTETGPVGFRP